jgi:hypothetical protein
MASGRSGIAPHRSHALALGLVLGDLDLAEFRFVIGKRLGKDGEQILRMLWRDAHDGFCTRLVDPRDLVEEDKSELVVFVSDLDHVAVDRVEVLRNIDRYLVLGHMCISFAPRLRLFWDTALSPRGISSGGRDQGEISKSAGIHTTSSYLDPEPLDP